MTLICQFILGLCCVAMGWIMIWVGGKQLHHQSQLYYLTVLNGILVIIIGCSLSTMAYQLIDLLRCN